MPASVSFDALDDQRYLEKWQAGHSGESATDGRFDAIVFNYAVNDGKAKFFAKNLLRQNGRLCVKPSVFYPTSFNFASPNENKEIPRRVTSNDKEKVVPREV